jgi:hypothetical protein
MSLPRWLKRFRKKQEQQQENRYDFPRVTTVLQQEYVTRQEYDAFVQRIELKLNVSEVPVEKLEFPSEILERLPQVVKKTIEGVIFNYEHNFPDFCFLGMRKALIDAIRVRFLKAEKVELLYDENGDAHKLEKWIELAKQQRYVSRTEANGLKGIVKVFGDTASHDYMTDLKKEEVPSVFICLRMALSRMYHPDEPT